MKTIEDYPPVRLNHKKKLLTRISAAEPGEVISTESILESAPQYGGPQHVAAMMRSLGWEYRAKPPRGWSHHCPSSFAPDPPPPAPGRPPTWGQFLAVARIAGGEAGSLIPLELRPWQEAIRRDWQTPASARKSQRAHIAVHKARQLGITTVVAALFFFDWLTMQGQATLANIAHDSVTTSNIRAMYDTFLQSMPKEWINPRKCPLDGRFVLTRGPTLWDPSPTGPTLALATAGTKGGVLRGFTPYRLHCTEWAFVSDHAKVRSSAWSVVPVQAGGRIIVESTASHQGDPLFEILEQRREAPDKSQFETHFFGWFVRAEYRLPVPPGTEWTEDELALAERHGLVAEQLQWRRVQISTTSEADFERDYPATSEEAYQGGVGVWLRPVDLAHIERLTHDMQGKPLALAGIHYLRDPQPGEHYAIGGDGAAGNGGDFTTAVVYNVRTSEVVAFYRCNTDPQHVAADHIWQLAMRYAPALVLIENNHWATEILARLRALKVQLYVERTNEFNAGRTGEAPHEFNTTATTKNEVLEALRGRLLEGFIARLPKLLCDELLAAKVDLRGRIEFPRTSAGHGDLAFSLALALRCARHVVVPPAPVSMAPLVINNPQTQAEYLDKFLRDQQRARLRKLTRPGRSGQ